MRRTTIPAIAFAAVFLLVGTAGCSLAETPPCPAFTAAMVDAAMLATDISQDAPLIVFAADDPADGSIRCDIETEHSDTFNVRVGFGVNFVILDGRHGPDRSRDMGDAVLRTKAFGVTFDQRHACRAEVHRSFVWNQYCAPFLP